MTADSSAFTDLGPATPPPNWCLPDTAPEWVRLTERFGGGMVCSWERKVSDEVWIECEDRIIDGRVMRSAPRIQFCEPPQAGVTVGQAHAIAEALTAAADVIACAELDEAQR